MDCCCVLFPFLFLDHSETVAVFAALLLAQTTEGARLQAVARAPMPMVLDVLVVVWHTVMARPGRKTPAADVGVQRLVWRHEGQQMDIMAHVKGLATIQQEQALD
jgi:hypothetical protein